MNYGKLNFSTSFDPTSAFPIDARTEFVSYDEALAKAKTAGEIGNTDSKYYYGMELTVVTQAGSEKYVIQPDNTLARINQTKTSHAIPEDGIAESGYMYFLGEIESLSVGFPSNASLGDMIFISYTSGSSAINMAVTTDNTDGLSDIMQLANRYYELIGMWNGSSWMFVTHNTEA